MALAANYQIAGICISFLSLWNLFSRFLTRPENAANTNMSIWSRWYYYWIKDLTVHITGVRDMSLNTLLN
ncbi:hypothetical protein ARALYDRAFT_894403 [Arabidopsis lyrata subsp. lyrata]|uniref:Uncharacterized protein n=1 Tax=Arabidopsis lyrata subsp. lyrata TaxID=81972 RepID=D7KUW2_ARALL|nr:hypothetical protein ARALYDRAFT_894403 [Arabidopsis lyrata subsp. lyrata]